MKTAVEWLVENCHIVPKNELNKKDLIKQAKEIEKQQIIEAYINGEHQQGFELEAEQYYKETYDNNRQG